MGIEVEVPTQPSRFPVPIKRVFFILFPGDSYTHKIDGSLGFFFKIKFDIQGVCVGNL